MKIKWESNSRVQSLAGQGEIQQEDVIERTTTDNFPFDTATVRMANIRAKKPFVTIHIRGKGQQKTNTFNNYTWNCAPTMRVNFGGNYYTKTYGVSGELDVTVDFTEVDRVVKEVADILKT